MTDFCELTLNRKGFYGVDFSKDFDRIKCVVFDMEGLWMEELPVATLIKRQKERNPTMDCTEALIDQTLLEAGCSGNYSATIAEAGVHFTAKYYLENYPITFQFFLVPALAQGISCHYIKPLWRTVLLQYAQIRALAEELKRKDAEIAQYQAEGARLSRTSVQTVPFDEQTFRHEFPMKLPKQSIRIEHLLESSVHRGRLMKTLDIEETGMDGSAKSKARLSIPTTQSISSPSRRKKKRARILAPTDLTKQNIEYDNEEDDS
uniref:XLF-like coiled-coil region domain-containing protein n=1 Tax=Anopheles coluzzii TaxID=1518534 RepID=A0A6E8W9Q0_ANOCL|nr:uncharacterized protein LOC120959461 [Anopheles coluzzii]